MAKEKFDYQKYLNYVRSADWLIKKSKLVMWCVKREITIKCLFCGTPQNLQVHHLTYSNLYNEDIIKDLAFLCDMCHKNHHIEMKK